jgi:superfamily I DNA and RNA helicase
VLLFSPNVGFVAVRVLEKTLFQRTNETVDEVDASLDDFTGDLHSRLVRSRLLRQGRTQTVVPIFPVILSLNGAIDEHKAEIQADVCISLNDLGTFVSDNRIEPLSDQMYDEVRSVVEGAKALTRSQKRSAATDKSKPLAKILADVEGQIAKFDEKQRHIALVDVGGPARIRGLAGSGKTVILAMKAAHLHLNNPEARILVTFLTKSLRSTIKSLITRFYRVYSDTDPDWKFIHVRHGWGGQTLPGVYSDACKRANINSLTLPEAKARSARYETPFAAACRTLQEAVSVQSYYDHVLIDEGQDFPDSFYKLAYSLCIGDRDKKSIVWAYDELQDIMNVKIREPSILFGTDKDGKPNVDLDRSSPGVPPGATNDAVLSRAYRNQRDVLVTAHALGFGVYGTIVQMLESTEHWEDVGYEVLTGPLKVGSPVHVRRPDANSPTQLQNIPDFTLIKSFASNSLDHEVEWVVSEAQKFLEAGVDAEDILVISLDDRNARSYFREITSQFSALGHSTNNLIADPYNEPPFSIEGKITLSTVYRAKGNEAAVVFAVGIDAINPATRDGRNKLFTAFTRTKAWLRVSGMKPSSVGLLKEINEAYSGAPDMKFLMPDPAAIETVQRGFSRKQAVAHAAKKKFVDELRAAGFTDEEIEEQMGSGDVIE